MENNSQWVDDRLRALDPPSGWRPDSAAALPKLRERETRYRTRRTRWIWSAMAAALFFLAILLTPAKCAFGVCRNPGEAAPPEAADPAGAPAQDTAVRFKESGNPDAPLTCEIFTDYECPHCAAVFDQVVPMLLAEYVQTGKMKLVHRDMPLAMHQYARLAARYANAAGRVGGYEIVVNQIFRTQAIWARTGDLDSQVAQVLPPDEMEKVRDMVKNDGHLDDSVTGDWAIAKQDGINQTPSLVVTYKGKRQVLAPVPAYPLLKSYLDELLAK
jgi:protein-disulfide isomerase